MTAQGRRGGSRRRRSSDAGATTPAIDTGLIEPAATAGEPVADLLEDTTVALTGTHRGGALGRALPGALVGAFLVAGLVFGAASPGNPFGSERTGPAGAKESASNEGAGDGGVAIVQHGVYGDGDQPKATDEAKPTDGLGGDDPAETANPGEPGDESQPTAKPETEPDKTPKPEKPKPDEPDPTKQPSDHVWIELAIHDGHPYIEWGKCEGVDFDYYKVVRSSDESVSWPTGEGDELIGVVERGGERKAWDKHAPGGRKAWYRVFCVRATGDGYKVVGSSNTERIYVPEQPEPPDPVTLQLEAYVNEQGKVVLDWSACDCEDFGFYKVVRSTTNENPSYLPWTDGTEVIGVIENKHETAMLDELEPGVTAYYRVQCLGWVGDHKVLLGQSAVVAVTMP
jgi:hypothetical protein